MGFFSEVIVPRLCDFFLNKPLLTRLRGELLEHVVVVIAVLLTRRRGLGCWGWASGRRQEEDLRIEPSPKSQQGADDHQQAATVGR